MSKVTRRGFLSSAGAVTGAVALGAATAGPTLVAAAADAAAVPAGPLPDEAVVAYIRNPRAGEVRLMVGHRETAIKDRALVQRIVAAAR
jgi:hypothetical protein